MADDIHLEIGRMLREFEEFKNSFLELKGAINHAEKTVEEIRTKVNNIGEKIGSLGAVKHP